MPPSSAIVRQLILFLLASLLPLLEPMTVHSQGLIGGIVRDVGRISGIRPLEKAGIELDNASRDFKDAVPLYGAIEEGASKLVREGFRDICAAPFQAMTNAVILTCSNYDGRLVNQHLIENAKNTLISSGMFARKEFDGIQIRWCPLRGASGMVPDRGRIYLDTFINTEDPIAIAALLAHEMAHVRQYRRLTTDRFKCLYSKQYVDCRGCQDRNHPLEREAYDFEGTVYQRLLASGWQFCNHSSEAITLALSHYDGQRWFTSGWFEIQKGRCEKLLSQLNANDIFWHAIGSDGARWEGTYEACVDPRAGFPSLSVVPSKCAPPLQLRKFRRIETGDKASWGTTIVDPAWSICNRTERRVNVAVMYRQQSAWLREGWIVLDPGVCHGVASEVEARNAYYYAESSDGGYTWSGTLDACVHPKKAFRLSDAECSSPLEVRKFVEVDIAPRLRMSLTAP